jgi:FKBP-type peptidyl-prolyl cis-trans isomerase
MINTPRPPKPSNDLKEPFTLHDSTSNKGPQTVVPGERRPKITSEVLRPMNGRSSHVRVGNIVRIEYELYKAKSGTTPIDSGKALFIVGAGSVLSGIEQGVIGMVHGEKRRIHIPPQLAF